MTGRVQDPTRKRWDQLTEMAGWMDACDDPRYRRRRDGQRHVAKTQSRPEGDVAQSARNEAAPIGLTDGRKVGRSRLSRKRKVQVTVVLPHEKH